MALTKPALATVNAGEPVTAQGWNALVSGLSTLYDTVIAIGGGTLDVAVTREVKFGNLPGKLPVQDAVVVAEPLGRGQGRPTMALPPFGTRITHLLVGLTDGSWRVHVRASGFTAEVREVTMPQTAPLAVALTVAGVVVPDLFGRGARAALDQVRALGIDVDLMLDTTGKEISRTALPAEYVDSPVLAQLPEAGTVVSTGTGRVRLVLASALRRDPVVTMPSLIGLSLTEAKEVVERIGLFLGDGTSVLGGPTRQRQ
ncbi:MAG: hypothetical protein LC635_00560 [Pseudonocardiaceae bacterium]|nr:hypothetical protein [Pseudonocardiaceae bacterium]